MKEIGDEYCRVFHLIRLQLNSLRNSNGTNKQTKQNKTKQVKGSRTFNWKLTLGRTRKFILPPWYTAEFLICCSILKLLHL